LIQGAFQHRSGRVISLARFVLAGVFLFAIWMDPSQPSRYASQAYAILIGYLAAAALYLAVTWNDWWRESRLAPAAHVVDILLFGVMVFLTEGYTSPFFTFFVFIILSATIKWGWRGTMLSAGAVILLFFGAGWASLRWGGGELELTRFLIRGTYLVVLSGVLVWFGINQRSTYLRELGPFRKLVDFNPLELPVKQALEYSASHLGAERAVFVLWDEEEPWVELSVLDASFVCERKAPDAMDPLVHPHLDGCVFIFDERQGRALRRINSGEDERVSGLDHPVHPDIAARGGSAEGIAIPIRPGRYGGYIFAFDIPGLCTDDLAAAERLSEEISSAFHRATAVSISEESTATRTRLSFARDLHDSVIQLLAGTSFRLEGIRNSAAAGRDIVPEVDALQQELSIEQRELREFIKQLQDGRNRKGSPAMCQTLRDLLERLGRQWGAECELLRCPEGLRLSPQLEHDTCQLVREAVANAVRHGKAKKISVSADTGDTGLSLIVADDGAGFVVQPEGGAVPPKPWSLNERVHELGGSLALYSSERGSRITISIPWAPKS
jgi:signal transduction histidine kinase